MKKFIQLLALIILTNVLGLFVAGANVHVWSGADYNVQFPNVANPNWSDPANWSSGGAPAVGEPAPVQLIFPTISGGAVSSNNISGLQVDLISLTGGNYNISSGGATITLKGGLSFTNSGINNTFDARLSLTGSNVLGAAASSSLRLGTIAGLGTLCIMGPGPVTFIGASAGNTFAGLTVKSGAVGFDKSNGWASVISPLTIGDTNASNTANVTCYGNDQIAGGVVVTLNRSGYLDFNGHDNALGGLIFNGSTLFTGNGLLTLQGDVSLPLAGLISSSISGKLSLGAASRVFDISTNGLDLHAIVSGAAGAGLVKNGKGYLTLLATNSYTGPTVINGGRLSLYGPTTNSAFTVNTGAVLYAAAATGPLTVNGGKLEIDNFGGFYGYLHCSGLALTNGATLEMDLNGTTPGVNCDQIKVAGPINLTGCTLLRNYYYSPPLGQQFLLIEQQGNKIPVTGTFNGLPEGATFTEANGNVFAITYKGGDGNDIVITRIQPGVNPLPPLLSKPLKMPNGTLQIMATGSSNYLYTVLSCTNLGFPVWTIIGTTTSGGNGTMTFTDATASSFPMRFYRFKAN